MSCPKCKSEKITTIFSILAATYHEYEYMCEECFFTWKERLGEQEYYICRDEFYGGR